MNEQTEAQPVYDLVSKSGKAYRMVEYKGKQVRAYEPKPGMQEPLYDPELGQLVRAAAPPITSENAAEMAIAMHDSRYNLKVEGVKRALSRSGKYGVTKGIPSADISDDEAITAVAEAITEHALDKYAPGSAHVKGKLVDMLDMMPDKRGSQAAQPPGTVTLTVTTTVEELRKSMEARYREDVVDGEVSDA